MSDDIVTTRRIVTLVVSEQVEPFGQWVMSLLCFSVHSLVSLLNTWCLLFSFGTYSLCCASVCYRDLIVVVITCLVSWCLLYHEFQCCVMYQTDHMYNLWSAMGWYGKWSGNTSDKKWVLMSRERTSDNCDFVLLFFLVCVCVCVCVCVY